MMWANKEDVGMIKNRCMQADWRKKQTKKNGGLRAISQNNVVVLVIRTCVCVCGCWAPGAGALPCMCVCVCVCVQTSCGVFSVIDGGNKQK